MASSNWRLRLKHAQQLLEPLRVTPAHPEVAYLATRMAKGINLCCYAPLAAVLTNRGALLTAVPTTWQ